MLSAGLPMAITAMGSSGSARLSRMACFRKKCRRSPSPRLSGGWFARLGKMLFRQGSAAMAERLGIGLLGQIPLVQSIREAGDNGEPVALGTRPDSLAFLELGRKLVDAENK